MAAKKAKKKATAKKAPAKKATAGPVAPRTPSINGKIVDGADPKKRKVIQALMNKINTKAKKPVLRIAADAPNTYWLRRPSGIMQLDIDTGGGLPAGGMSTIGGPDNVGKSLLLYMYFAMNQKIHGRSSAIAYAPPEGGIDFWWARRVGWVIPIPDDLIEAKQRNRSWRGVPLLTKTEIDELQTEIGTNIRIDGDNAEKLLDNVLDCVRCNEFQIVSVDSFDALMPATEASNESVGDHGQQGARATALTNFSHRYHPITCGFDESGPNFTTLIATTQVRANRKKSEMPSYIAKYAPDSTESVARAIKHARLIALNLSRGDRKYESTAKGKPKGKILSKTIKWVTEKGKAGTHDGITGEVVFDYLDLIDTRKSIIQSGIRYGIIAEDGNGALLVLRPENKEVICRFEYGLDQFCDDLYDDFELELKVRREVLAAAGISCCYK